MKLLGISELLNKNWVINTCSYRNILISNNIEVSKYLYLWNESYFDIALIIKGSTNRQHFLNRQQNRQHFFNLTGIKGNLQTPGIVYHLRRKNMNMVIQLTKFWPTTYYNNMFGGSKLPFLVVHLICPIQEGYVDRFPEVLPIGSSRVAQSHGRSLLMGCGCYKCQYREQQFTR